MAPDYPDTAIAAPWKTGLALSGLVRLWRLTGEEPLKQAFLAGCEWLVTEGVGAEGLPYYYSPYDLRVSMPQTETIAVEPLADAG